MIRLAYRNLFQSYMRLTASVGGVALALLLIFSLDAIMAGAKQQMTAYIDHSNADLFVAQRGVRNMHMSSSSLPRALVDQVAAIEAIAEVAPILYLTNVIDVGDEQFLAYIIGVEQEAEMGIPWAMAQGSAIPSRGEIVVDETIARSSGLELGDPVSVLGTSFQVAGFAKGTTSLINSVAFIHLDDFFAQRGSDQTISYLLARTEPGADPAQVAERIERQIGDVTVSTQSVFSNEEGELILDMGADIIVMMNLIGLLIGLAVTGLTTYTSVRARLPEYGMLKALGARNSHLYTIVIGQAFMSTAIGYGVAVILTLTLGYAIPAVVPELTLNLTAQALSKVAVFAGAIALVAAMLPIQQIASLDPARIFRR